ncbi:MAG: hypothetical protein UZ14_CFX002002556 [Chloroflexi bacterium OLB14]|nr:MAG: hypothetical protein UZ14_CFX002002556 [Chloroflexi bacterium OLB14]
MSKITEKQMSYICREILDLKDWFPSISNIDEVLQVLDLCESNLEIMYLLGSYHYIEKNGKESTHTVGYITDAGDSAAISSSFLRLIIFLAGRLRRLHPTPPQHR